jgi:hypothetical protein
MAPDMRMDPRLEQRLAEKKAVLDLQRPLPAAIVTKLYADLRMRLTYHSNAIEGNTLDLSETQLVIEPGMTIGGHTVREHLEALHHADAYALLLDLARADTALDQAAITSLHALALRDLVDAPGQYRTGAVLISGSEYRCALELAHHGQYSALVNLIGRAAEVGLDMFLEACSAVPEELQRPLREIAQACAIDADYLGWLLREGRIAGQKRRGRWYTSEAAVRRYQDEVASGAVPVGRPRKP